MKRAFVRLGAIGLSAAVCIGTAAFWSVRKAHSARRAESVAAAADRLAANPPLKGDTATDRQIAKWAAEARRDEKNGSAWVNLGDALMQKARETVDAAYYGHAEKAYRKALALDGKSIGALVGMAWVNGGRHEFEQSIAFADRALAVDPNNNEAYGLISDAKAEMGDYDGAVQACQKMLDLRPDVGSFSRGAHLLFLTGNTRRAILLMAKAIGTGAPYAENTSWCRAQLALMLFSNGNTLAAEQTLKATLAKTPNNPYVLAAVGKALAAKKDLPGAIDYYKRAIAVVPMHDSLVALGDLYRLTGKRQEAEQQYAMVEAIHKLYKSLGVRGDMQVAMFDADHDRNLPEALRMAEDEVKTRKNVYALDTLAWCYLKNGRAAEAMDTIRQAMSRNTQEPLFLFHAGMICSKLGETEQAKRYLYDALSLNSAFSPVYASVAANTLRQLSAMRPESSRLAAHQEEFLRQ